MNWWRIKSAEWRTASWLGGLHLGGVCLVMDLLSPFDSSFFILCSNICLSCVSLKGALDNARISFSLEFKDIIPPFRYRSSSMSLTDTK